MLIQLPNEEWVNPQDVQRVSVQDDRTVVRVAGDDVLMPHAGPQVYEQRDRIAEQVNTACVIGGQRC